MGLKLKGKKQTTATKATASTLAEAKKEATHYRELVLKSTEIKGELDIAKADLVEKVLPFRNDELRRGVPTTTVKVPTVGGHEVSVLFTERWSGLTDPDDWGTVREAFGDKYELLVEEKVSLRPKTGVKLTAGGLRSAIGEEAWAKLSQFYDITPSLVPRKGAAEQIAALYASKEDEMGEDLLDFMSACSQAPTVKAK